MIEGYALTKRYGATIAVDNLDFAVRPGLMTGFVGPNGAGKTTTMRMILGLDSPTHGTVTVGRKRYADSPVPLGEVGAPLDPRAVHSGRSAYHHLTITVLVGVTVVALAFAGLLGRPFARWWPTITGLQITTTLHAAPDALPAWAGLGVFAATVAVLMSAAYAVFRSRDAA